MTRTYELGFIVEPRVPDEEAQALCAKYKGMIEDSGAQVTHVDDWGKRKLAYPIRKYNEGRYFFLYVSSEAEVEVPWPTVERLLMQDEKTLRHLLVRTDEDIKRAMRKGKIKPELPGSDAEAEPKAADAKADAEPKGE